MPGSASSSCCPQKPPSLFVLCTTRGGSTRYSPALVKKLLKV
jgi:hypothetical protein